MSQNAKLVLILVLVVAFLSTYFYFDKLAVRKSTIAGTLPVCGTSQTQDIIIKNNSFIPQKIAVRRCTLVKFINQDTTEHLVAFGPHDDHIEYPGFFETLLKPGLSEEF